MAEKILIGVRKFNSTNKNKDYEVMLVKTPLNPRALESGSFGSDVDEIFVPETMMGTLTPADIEKPIVLDYEISGGRAYLTGFKVKK